MQLFFGKKTPGNLVLLDEEESRHCAQVLRKRPGDVLLVVDGDGNLLEGPILEIGKKQVTISVQKITPEFGKRARHLHVAIAPTKNMERLEWFFEKAAETGIDEISLLLCEHSERTKTRLDRLQKILVSAMKQSLTAYLPRLNDLTKFEDFVKKDFAGAQKFIGYCGVELPPLKEVFQPEKSTLIMIGPEGDFSKKEFEMAVDSGFAGISLGATRLRTETAGLVATVLANYL